MARQARAPQGSQFAARDLADDFRSRDTGDSIDPLYPESPIGAVDADPVAAAKDTETAAHVGQSRLASLAPPVRAMFTYMARLARSLVDGPAPEFRPLPTEQRSRGVVLVVMITPEGKRTVFR